MLTNFFILGHAEEALKLKCPKCGTENQENAKFCEECGSELSTPAIKSEGMKTSPNKSTLGKKNVLIIAVVIIIGLVAAGVYIFYQPSAISPQNATVFIVSAVSGTAQVVDPTNNNTYDVNVDYYGISGGSGFIITSDGYITTAAHVVGDPWELENNGIIREITDDDLKFYVDKAAIYIFLEKAHPELVNNLTDSQLNELTNQFMAAGAVKATSYNNNIYIRGPAFPESSSDPVKATLVDIGDSDSETDVALLKVDNVSKLPYLPLTSQKINVGDSVRIYGYPTEQFAFYSDMETEGGSKELWNSIYTATLTSGIVSAERPTNEGTMYYQTDAAVDSGSSGGPVCNTKNQVIGILVQGFEKQGFNFFLPSEYIIQMCNENRVKLGGSVGSILPF
ncbi:trypsin-like peptidase domain-containing protein [Methanobacterium ferruginis]|uniref:trypsin-like peptidase domain-containing protein n=1 Tax=Methanobacterium ferruginis TaxID=710191 RepID=UPI002573EBF0|nr:trypsin-like peptidase domain-containing protein [Methanobacterium ferruginis]BDZ68887.1 hypothetical protein GCM10025860_23350 [Methanobacterium ferruginis]